MKVVGTITGLSEGKHGLHIHQYGDLSDGCASTGVHYNPYGNNHGGPTDDEHHVGDLGNIVANSAGVAEFEIHAELLNLNGPYSVVGRAIVVSFVSFIQ